MRTLLYVAIAAILPLGSSASSLLAAERSALHAARESIRGDDLKRHIGILADDTFEGRAAGSRGGRAAAVYLTRELERLGLQPAGTEGWFQTFRGSHRNVLAKLPGADPKLRDEYLVVGAHYDHVGYGTPRNSYGPYGYIHNGADDNASGAAGLIEVAEAFVQSGIKPRRSILFVFWDGEEGGLLGSKHWMAQPTVPLAQVKLGVNLDMIGRMRNGQLEVYGVRTARGLRRLVGLAAEETGLQLDFTWRFEADSDHWSFYERNIPVLMFHTGKHNDYHRPSDDVEKINHDGVQQTSRMLFSMLASAADADRLEPFRPEARGETAGMRLRAEQPLAPAPPRLGLVWDEADPTDGLHVTRVMTGTPAAQAGVQVGDRIQKLDGAPIASGDAFRRAILQADGEIVLELTRAGQAEPLRLAVPLAGKPTRVGISWTTDDAEPGMLILRRVVPGSPAADAGLRVYDRLYQLNGVDITSGDEFLGALASAEGPVDLLVERSGKMLRLKLELPPLADPEETKPAPAEERAE